MLSPKELKAKLILSEVKCSEIAQKHNITRSQVSSIINHAQAVIREIYLLIGENPFQLTDKEIFELNKCIAPKNINE